MMQPGQVRQWSPSEKQIARRAFERALEHEKEDAIREFKERVAQIRNVADIGDLWELEDWLRNRRRAIDDKYDYRYSVLASVLGQLISDGRIAEADLKGLDSTKVEEILRVARLHREWAQSK